MPTQYLISVVHHSAKLQAEERAPSVPNTWVPIKHGLAFEKKDHRRHESEQWKERDQCETSDDQINDSFDNSSQRRRLRTGISEDKPVATTPPLGTPGNLAAKIRRHHVLLSLSSV